MKDVFKKAPIVITKNDDLSLGQLSVEPPNWWTGMNVSRLTLTVHGRNAALARPSLPKDCGLSLKRTITTDSVNYLFLELEIDPEAKPANVDISFDSADGRHATLPFPLLARQRSVRCPQGIDSSDAVYLLMPDRFADGNPERDSVEGMTEKANRRQPYGRHGGDLTGIRQNIGYIYGLGMTALWTTPIMVSNMPKASYHGYATTNYYDVDPRLGSLADYKMLATALHQRGMKLIMDMVVNHCGTAHPWLQDAPASDWFNAWEGFPVRTNYRPGVASDIHASDFDKDRTVKGWFDESMADINMSNPLVIAYFTQCAIWWIEQVGISAIRMDTFPYADAKGMTQWVRGVRQEFPGFTIIGETWIDQPALLAPWQKGASTPGLDLRSELTVMMDFPLMNAIAQAFNEDFSWGTAANRLYDAIANDCIYANPYGLLVFADNHDAGRILTRLAGDTDALKMALVFLATTRGIPQLYYGTEVALDGNGWAGHAHIRQDMPGGWPADKKNFFDDRPAKQDALYDFVGSLFSFRKRNALLHNGLLTHFVPDGNVYVFFRHTASKKDGGIMVALNLGKSKATIFADRFKELNGGSFAGTDVLNDKRIKPSAKMTIQPRSALLLEYSFTEPAATATKK